MSEDKNPSLGKPIPRLPQQLKLRFSDDRAVLPPGHSAEIDGRPTRVLIAERLAKKGIE
jgi:hypothetical protein